MKKFKLLGFILGLSLFMGCNLVSAEPAVSIDDIGSSVTVAEDVAGGSLSGTQQEALDFMGKLSEASDLSEEKETAVKAAEPIKNLVAIVVQILSYVITIGLALKVVLDLCYIALPFSRTFLANGHVGTPQSSNAQAPMGGMQGGMMGGMGMGMNRPMGMGMGMGMNRPMGMGMGMGSPMGMQGGMMGGAGNADVGSAMGKIQWVSSAALNAAASESTVGPDGKSVNPFKIYAKDMIIVLVLTPILLVLAVTGTLTELGFLLGEAVTHIVQNLGGMI